MNFDYFVYNEKNIFNIKASKKDFITIIGEKNKDFINNILFLKENDYLTLNYSKINKNNVNKLYQLIGYASVDLINTFTSNSILEEILFGLESKALKKSDMEEKIKRINDQFKFDDLNISPILTDISTKAKISLARVLIMEPKILIIDNLLSLLDKDDKKIVLNILKEYNSENIILNFTNEIEESLLGNKIIIANKDKILISGETLSVLNEERILKRLGIGLPFKILLNKYLKDYELIDKYYLSYESMVNKLWK